jgi:dGTP triphosphohydrolase
VMKFWTAVLSFMCRNPRRSPDGFDAGRSRVGMMVPTAAKVKREELEFEHPLLRYRAHLPGEVGELLDGLKDLTLKLVIDRAEIHQLERRGQRIVTSLFEKLVAAPDRVIPREGWASLDEGDPVSRRVCDYIAGMTDRYAERIYQRLFVQRLFVPDSARVETNRDSRPEVRSESV